MAGAGWSSLVARRAHNPKVVGSNPAPATRYSKRPLNRVAFLFVRDLSDPAQQLRHYLPTSEQVIAYRLDAHPGAHPGYTDQPSHYQGDAQRWSIASAAARLAHFLIRGAPSAQHPSVHA